MYMFIHVRGSPKIGFDFFSFIFEGSVITIKKDTTSGKFMEINNDTISGEVMIINEDMEITTTWVILHVSCFKSLE